MGISLYSDGLERATEELISYLDRPWEGTRLISATGAHGIVEAADDPSFRVALNEFFWNLPDGTPAVWVGRLKGAKHMTRCYGPEFFARVMSATARTPVRHFFCGGKPGVADELKEHVKRKFRNENVVGTFCPPFRPLSDVELSDIGGQIDSSGTQVVWIGLSTPKQERFARRLKEKCHAGFIITVGAAFDFHTDRVRQAPHLVQRVGLEWLFRLVMEPKRLFRRYFEIVPKFIVFSIIDLSRYFARRILAGEEMTPKDREL